MSPRDPASPSRRRFLLRGAGLTVGFALAPAAAAAQTPPQTPQSPTPQPPVPAQAPRLPGSLQANRRLDGWLRVNADGTVTAFTGKVELGQGILTALVQIVADELDVDARRVEIVSGDTARSPNEGITSGSLSIEQGGTALRFASAEVRHLLLAAAAEKLTAAAAELRVEDGTITSPRGARATYWELTNAAMLQREATAAFAPKAAAAHRVIGTSMRRRDLPAKVTGGAAYVQDLRLPGMVFGRVVRPPSPRARLRGLDEAKARGMPGVVALVRDGSFLGVAAAREEQAIAAADALRSAATWDERAALPPSGPALFAWLRGARSQEDVVRDEAEAAAPAVKVLSATYTRPYQAHASIGPSCAVAQWTGGKLRVWSHSQGVFNLRSELAKVLRIPVADVTVAHREGSGCYGHNGADDVALDAALVARAAGGRPVKLQWMRDDEFGWEPYGSAMAIDLRAGLDAKGEVVAWQNELWSHTHTTRPGESEGANLLAAWYLADALEPGPARNIPQPSGGGDRNAIPLYAFPRQRVVNHLVTEMPLRVSALRTLGAYANVFALESFMDELAAAAAADPLEFRLRHLADQRARSVLEAVAAKAGWRAKAAGGGGRGRGLGFARYKNHATYVAVVADVEVDRASGDVRVTRAWAAADAGLVVNPDGLANQIEGGVLQAASWTLRESVAFDRTRIRTASWADYPILLTTEVPAVEVTILDRPDEPPVGVGEASLGPTAAAIGNAVAHATGRRLRDLPLTPERVKAALG
ncbi:MAG: molybdopterin cofactor-binding domain-containing protein [Anaeromyxobacteraceae bacterium]